MVVRVDGHAYGLSLDPLLQVLPARAVTPIPGAPASVLGLATAAGRMVTVVDLGALLGGAEGARPRERWVMARVDGRSLALAVDEVLRVDRGTPAPAAASLPAARPAARVDLDLLLLPLFAPSTARTTPGLPA